MFETTISYSGELSAIVTRADGSVEDLGIISGARPVLAKLPKPLKWYERLWNTCKREGKIPAAMALGTFIAYLLNDHSGAYMMGVVTTSGVGYLASDFASGAASPHIGALNFHDCGTGTTSASTKSITGATNASPIVITATAHGYTTNDLVIIASVGGNTNANNTWQISAVTTNTFSLLGSTGNSAYTSGGTAQLLNGAGDTALTTAAGTARVAGTQSNPSANVYKSIATISFTSSLTISEWGMFSASTSGTLWDRRWFNTAGAPATTASAALIASTIGVNNGDSIQFTYQLTCTQGGS
jgi:hypothetical protein